MISIKVLVGKITKGVKTGLKVHDEWLRANTLSTWGYTFLSMLCIDIVVFLLLMCLSPEVGFKALVLSLFKIVLLLVLKLVFPELSKYYIHDTSVKLLLVIIGLLPLIVDICFSGGSVISYSKGCLIYTFTVYMANKQF